jgi:hypothetical protein
MGSGSKAPAASAGVDIDKIRPGMSEDELAKVRQEISRVASQALRGF